MEFGHRHQNLTREIPLYFQPKNLVTSGNNNVYWSGDPYLGTLVFGHSSHTNNTYAIAFIRLPKDYKHGSDLVLSLNVLCFDTDNPNTIDYQLQPYYANDGEAYSLIASYDGTFSITDNFYANYETITISGTNLKPHTSLYIRLELEDDNNAGITTLGETFLQIEVTGVD